MAQGFGGGRQEYIRGPGKTVTLQPRDVEETLSSWCDAMSRTDRGRLALRNIKFDLRHGRISREDVRRFLAEVVQLWHGKAALVGSLAPKNPALEVFKAATNATAAWCHGNPKVESHCRCVAITSASVFFERVDRLAAGYPYDDEVRESHLEDLEDKGSLAGLLKTDATAPFSGRPVGWVTDADAIADLRGKYDDQRELAARLRAKLGLHHHSGGTDDEIYYVEVGYPADAFWAAPSDTRRLSDLMPPTFLDAGVSRVYRSADPGDGWGRTVDLEGARDGLPEAVHPRIPMRGDFTVRRVGQPDRESTFRYPDVGAGPDAWEAGDCADLVALCLTS